MRTPSFPNQPRCEFCGRFFKPHPSQGSKQKACDQPDCREARKKSSQQRWVDNNPGYFKGRSSYIKTWRTQKPDYQKAWRASRRREIQDTLPPKSSIITLHIAVTDKKLHLEIQDALQQEKAAGRGFVVCGVKREIQDTLACQPHSGP